MTRVCCFLLQLLTLFKQSLDKGTQVLMNALQGLLLLIYLFNFNTNAMIFSQV